MTEPHFAPWKGARYETAGYGGTRLLVVGDSHYGKPAIDDHEGFTREVVRAHIAEAPPHLRFFRRIEALITGREIPDRNGREVFWQAISFYNFVQTLLPEDRSGRDPRLWQAARDPFLTTLQALRPHAVLVVSATTWNCLSKSPLSRSKRLTDASSEPVFRWTVGDDLAMIATWTNHPTGTRGFSVPESRRRVMALLAASGATRSPSGPTG